MASHQKFTVLSIIFPAKAIMRIITHNMLKCNVRGVENGYPLIIEAEKTEVVECDFNKREDENFSIP